MENNSSNSFFLSPTNKSEISSIISCLNPNKFVGPKSIPTKILKLLKDEISSHLFDIYNISFQWVYFHQSWKLPKSYLYIKRTLSSATITIVKYLFYQILKKLLEKLVYNRITKFLITIILSTHFSLVFDIITLSTMP